MAATDIEILPFGLNLLMNEFTRLNLKKTWGSLKVLTLFSETPFNVMAENLKTEDMEVDCTQISASDKVTLFSCTAVRKISTSTIDLEITGNFYALQKPPFLYFITGDRNPFLSKVLLHIIGKLSPTVLRTFVTSEDLLNLLNNFSKAKKIDLRYTEFVYKSTFAKAFTVRRNEKRVDFSQYEPFPEAFRKAREQGGRIDRIRVFGKGFSFSISRSGLLRIYRGDFTDYFAFFISRIGEIAVGRWKIFEKRARRESPSKEVRPVLVSFESNVFENEAERKLLIRTLGEYSNCEYSVIHGGNPHVYLVVLDKLDNSSFTVRTYDNNSLILFPQIRTSMASLVRFSKHLLDKFEEGNFGEFQL